MTIQTNFPAIKPSLLLDFANTEALDPRITFTRASTATYYGTQTAKAEENLLTFSQEIGNPLSWSFVSAAITANSIAAPDGTTTADTLTASVGSSDHRVSQTSLSIAGSQRVFSVFAKAGTNNFVQLAFGGDVNAYANFNITAGAGAVGTVGSSTTASIVDAGGGWYRCVITTSSATASTLITIPIITSATAARLEFWTATGTETVFLWGAQLEQRSAVTAYTPTTTQPITNYIPVLQTAASGVARFDHNPTTFESLGLLIEESRTNLLVRSEEFDNASWTKGDSSITANTVVAPSGALAGDKLVENTSNANHIAAQSFSFVGGTTYTLSVYAKAAERTSVRLSLPSAVTTDAIAAFNLATGVVSSTGTGVTSALVTSVGGGWFRCSITVTATNSATGNVTIWILNPSSPYTGNGYSGLYIWGAQLEAGAFPTSYIPTVASQVTRAADAASMTGTNFSSWYNQAEGTFYAAVSVIDAETPTSQVFLEARSDATNLLGMYVQVGDGFLANNCVVGGVTQAQLGLVDLPNAPASFANAFAYKVNDFAGVYNGAAAVTDASGTVPANTALYIGNRGDLARPLNGTIRKIAYYPLRVSNTNLQALTS